MPSGGWKVNPHNWGKYLQHMWPTKDSLRIYKEFLHITSKSRQPNRKKNTGISQNRISKRPTSIGEKLSFTTHQSNDHSNCDTAARRAGQKGCRWRDNLHAHRRGCRQQQTSRTAGTGAATRKNNLALSTAAGHKWAAWLAIPFPVDSQQKKAVSPSEGQVPQHSYHDYSMAIPSRRSKTAPPSPRERP